MKKNTGSLIAALALGAGLALAQPTAMPAAPAAPAPMACGMSGMQGMKGMMGAPGMPEMTAEQQEKMDALRVAHLKVILPLQTEVQVKEIELDALWRADEPDARKIIAKVNEIGDLRQKLEVARVTHQLDMRKLLTPEQRKVMKKMGMGRGMMGKGMGRKMRGMMGKDGGCGMMGQGMGPGMGMGSGPMGNCQNCPMK
jgi:Spy/CpxP family protein refolding chaperone